MLTTVDALSVCLVVIAVTACVRIEAEASIQMLKDALLQAQAQIFEYQTTLPPGPPSTLQSTRLRRTKSLSDIPSLLATSNVTLLCSVDTIA
jgi:hypothetical protein